MDPYAVSERLCKESVGVSFAEVSLADEGQLVQIVSRLDVLGLDTLFVHEVTVILHVFVNVLYLSHKTFVLELFHVLTGHTFDFLVPILFHWIFILLYILDIYVTLFLFVD